MNICDKVNYGTHKEAIAAIVAIWGRDKTKMKAYKCNDCDQFHLATIGKKKKMRNLGQKSSYEIKMKVAPAKTALAQNGKQKSQPLSTGKMMTKEFAENLKRLVEGTNQMQKK